MESLHIRVIDFTADVEFVKGEVDHASDKARGQGVQAGFKVFR